MGVTTLVCLRSVVARAASRLIAALVLASVPGLRLFAQDPMKAPEGATQGIPWSGAPGITESVAAIMARQQARDSLVGRPLALGKLPLTLLERLALPETLDVAPDSPAVSRWPIAGTSAVLEVFEPNQPQPLGVNFLGISRALDSSTFPPDTTGGVGPTQVLVAANGRLKVFDKTGVLGALDVDDATFWGSVSGLNPVLAPRVIYDRLSARWFLTIVNVPTPLGPNRILIAVSSGPTITDATSFTFFSFQQNVPLPAGTPTGFANDDTLGVDRFALYIGANIFNQDLTAYLGSDGFVVNKANLIAATPTLTVTAFRQVATGAGVGCTTPQGVTNDDPAATEGYFIGVDRTTAGRLVLRRVSTPGATPAISANLNLTVPTTRAPIGVVALNVPAPPLDGVDDRLSAAHVRRNKLTGTSSLWTAHNLEVDATGVAAAGGRNGSRWYEIESLTGTPALRQSGTLFDSAATNPRSYWIPSVNMSGQGHMVLGSSFASVADYAGVAVAGRFAGDALGATAAPTIAQPGLFAYDDTLGGTTQRWGDYSQTAIDPTDDMTVWTFQEYAETGDLAGWGVRATQLLAPPPATPSSASPSTVDPGQAAVSVTVTGTSTSGSGFFDPGPDTGGPGFTNHIAATVSGGVTVNSVTVTSPTQVTLSLNTTGAPSGLKTVTITNPDGQAANGAILRVPAAILSGTKTVAGTFLPASAVTYTVTLTNTGFEAQGDNPGNEFTDVLPASLTLVSANASSGAATATVGTNTVTWNGGLGVSASVTITIQATIAVGVTVGIVVSNQGSISYDNDGNATNEAAGLTDDPTVGGPANPTVFTVGGTALLSGTKTVGGTFLPSGNVTYTVALTNSGTAPQADNPGNELTDILPPSLTLVSANASSGAATATVGTNTVTWNGGLGVSATVTITIQATIGAGVSSGTLVSNQGSISYDNDANGSNEASAQTDDPAVAGPANPTVFAVRGAYFTLVPCRVVDTRDTPNGPLAGPALVAGESRSFGLAGNCGIPAAATALSLNVTVTQPTGAGNLRLFPAGSAAPLVSTINWSPGQTRANNAVAVLSPTGLAVQCDQASGSVHLILDVNGYFQ